MKIFQKLCTKLGFEHNLLFNQDLTKRLGTNFYNIALYTKGGILLHPGKLVRAMIDARYLVNVQSIMKIPHY